MSAMFDVIRSKGQLLVMAAAEKVKDRHPTAICAMGFAAILMLLSLGMLTGRPKERETPKAAPVQGTELSATQKKRLRAKAAKSTAKGNASENVKKPVVEQPAKAVEKIREPEPAATPAAKPAPKPAAKPAPKPAAKPAESAKAAGRQAQSVEQERSAPKMEKADTDDSSDGTPRSGHESGGEAAAKTAEASATEGQKKPKKSRKKKAKAPEPEKRRSVEPVVNTPLTTAAGTPYEDDDNPNPWISVPEKKQRRGPKSPTMAAVKRTPVSALLVRAK
eukprot:Selendium_serpulae@DN6191_c1_g1_i1.p1